MKRPQYTVLGFITWQVAKIVAKRKAKQQGPKAAAVLVILGIVFAGVQLAREERS